MKNENLFGLIFTIHNMWLIHETSITALKKILKDGYLRPSSHTKNRQYDVSLQDVYMSVLFDDMTLDGQGGPVDVLLIFPLEIMKRHPPKHWSSAWVYGITIGPKGHETTLEYTRSKSPEENAKRWHTAFRTRHSEKRDFLYSKGKNEVVFSDAIPIDEVAFIYIRKDIAERFRIDNPKKIDTKQKLNKLLKQTSSASE
jgi:hypothetical protein